MAQVTGDGLEVWGGVGSWSLWAGSPSTMSAFSMSPWVPALFKLAAPGSGLTIVTCSTEGWSASVPSLQSLLISSLNFPFTWTVVSRHSLLPASTATHLLTLPIEVHERMAGLGDIWHSHPLVHPIDMEMQSPRAVEPQSQDGTFRTRVQIWPKLLTDLGGRDLLSSQRADSHQQQPPPPSTLLQVASPWALPPHLPTVWVLPPASMT